MNASVLRNTLLACGAYYLALWLYVPLTALWSVVSNRLSFTVGVETIVLMPIVLGLPELVLAGAVGAVVAATAAARHPSRWALLPAALFVTQHAFARHSWARPPDFDDRVRLVVEAVLPAVVCILAATIVEGRAKRPAPDQALHS